MVYTNSDIIVVGGGPAGMSAAINAGAEGFHTTLIETKPTGGGRAEPSHAIENYFGFLSVGGRELAQEGREQLQKFNVNIVNGFVDKCAFDGEYRLLQLSDSRTFKAYDIIIATGMSHRDSSIPGANLWGVFYHAEPLEVEKWKAKVVVVVGGENSATQAALNFANHGARVIMLMRSDEMKMSAYLRPMLDTHENITLRNGQIKEIHGENGACKSIVLESEERLGMDAVVLFGGAEPRTYWLRGLLELDGKGFIVTDSQFRSTLQGVWAIGDVRAGSVKRIGSAVGEGTSVIRYIMMERRGR